MLLLIFSVVRSDINALIEILCTCIIIIIFRKRQGIVSSEKKVVPMLFIRLQYTPFYWVEIKAITDGLKRIGTSFQ